MNSHPQRCEIEIGAAVVILIFLLAESTAGIGEQSFLKESFLQSDIRIGAVGPLPHVDPCQPVFPRVQIIDVELRGNAQFIIHRFEARAAPEKIEAQSEGLSKGNLISLAEEAELARTVGALPAGHRHPAELS